LPQADDIHFAAVRVTDSRDDAAFTARERTEAAKLTVPKRNAEWRAGRLAAKKAVVETHPGMLPTDVEIRPDPPRDGLTLSSKARNRPLGLHHAPRRLGDGGGQPAPLGIDLETVEDRARSFLEEDLSVNELKVLL